MSRPVYVLASKQADRNTGLTYTLRTRVSRPEAENELSKVMALQDSTTRSALQAYKWPMTQLRVLEKGHMISYA